jgi:thiol:disulfide interchange protein DsbA
MNCQDSDRMLNNHEDRSATPAERARLDAHLAGCPRCEQAWFAHRILSDAAVATPRPELLSGIVAGLPAQRSAGPASTAARKRRPGISWAVAASVAMIVLVVGWILQGPNRSPLPAANDGQPAVAATAPSDEGRLLEGTHYRSLAVPAFASQAGDKIEIVEVFMYWCFPCFAFEPHFAAWAQSRVEEIHVVRVPAYWGRNAALHARAFYAAELLGIGDAVHAAFFNELHVAKRSLDTEDALAAFFETFGVDNARFRRVLNSDAVTALAAGAEQLVRQYQVTGTPSLIVNGEFVTGGAMADSYENLIEIVDELTSRQAACERAAERSNCRVRAAGMPLR